MCVCACVCVFVCVCVCIIYIQTTGALALVGALLLTKPLCC